MIKFILMKEKLMAKELENGNSLVSRINIGLDNEFQADHCFNISMEQIFPKGINLKPEQIHKIGKRLIEELDVFDNYKVILSTHIGEDISHNHFYLSKNDNNEMRLPFSPVEIKNIKELSQALIEEYHELDSIDSLQPNNKQFGWKYELFLAIRESSNHGHSKSEFINNMDKLGYSVQWDDQDKYITFTTPAGKKCRNNKLYPEESFTKNKLIDQFTKNAERDPGQIEEHRNNMDRLAVAIDFFTSEYGNNFNENAFCPLSYLEENVAVQEYINDLIVNSIIHDEMER